MTRSGTVAGRPSRAVRSPRPRNCCDPVMPENNTPGPNRPHPRILFVEDEATLREHLAQKLSDEYIVDTAGNGNEALLAVIRAKPALVVSDIVMPDMDGVELLKTLRQSPGTRGIPVLLISGRAADEYRIEGFEEGADGFLAKPYTERELRALIGSMLRSAQLRAEAAGREARDQVIGERKQIEQQLQQARAELHRREEQLIQNEQRLEEADRRKRELLATLAQELCKPLEPFHNGLEVLRSRASADEVSQRIVNTMARQMLNLMHLADDLMDVSRLMNGGIPLKRERIVLSDVLANSVAASRPLIEAHAHELLIDAHPAAPVFIYGDLTRLTQVFSNLLSNSAKYTDRGGKITLTLDCQGGEAVVNVQDTGIGIAPHALERVFEMFFRVRPDDPRSDGGLGLGLCLARTFTQMHGGSVSAWSAGEGTGSVFTVRLPIMRDGLAVSDPAADNQRSSPVNQA
jgi:signal transduction histidine kinase